jgi:protein-disulfide isomerase/uncharacterized membrane protein
MKDINAKTLKQLNWISILSAVGTGISAWQTALFHQTRSGVAGFHSFCNIGQTFDCTAIEMSPYAEFLGMPLSAVAVAGFLFIFLISLFARNASLHRSAHKVLLGLSAVSILFSLVYLGIMIGVIGKLCLLCLGVDFINLIILILVIRLPKIDVEHTPLPMPQLLGSGAASLIAAFLLSLALNPQSQMKASDKQDLIDSVMGAAVKEFTVPADAPVIGNPNAKVTIVKFSDYQCPACKMAASALHPLYKRYADQVKFVFVNFPLDATCNSAIKSKMHDAACESAAAAICAQEQGKFSEVYEALFEQQTELKSGKIAELVQSVPGLDLERLKTCMTQPSTVERIKRDVQLGIDLPIQSTPTFFINGRRVEGGLPTNLWMNVIDQILKNSK